MIHDLLKFRCCFRTAFRLQVCLASNVDGDELLVIAQFIRRRYLQRLDRLLGCFALQCD